MSKIGQHQKISNPTKKGLTVRTMLRTKKPQTIFMALITAIFLTSCIQSKEEKHIEAMVTAVLDELKLGLKDPYSVKFSNLRYHRLTQSQDGTITLCGSYNAKNSMGAYAGNDVFFGTASKLSASVTKVSVFTANGLISAGLSDDYISTRCISSGFVKYEMPAE